MKILVVTQRYDPDPFLINEIAPEMVRRGHEVTVLTGLPSEAEKREKYRLFRNRREKINGVDVIRCYEAKRRDSAFGLALNYMSFALIASLKSLFLSRKFDCVFCYQLSPVTQILPAAVYRKVAGKKLLTYCLDIFPESVLSHTSQNSIVYKIVAWMTQKLYACSDKICVTSQTFVNYIHEVNQVSLEKLYYLPQHASDDMLNMNLEAADNGVADFMFAGNIGYAQVLETVVAAAERLASIRSDFFIHIVGDGARREELEKMVYEKGLESYFRFYGQRSRKEMPSLYTKADALLLTLRGNTRVGDTLPGKLQTYMTTGKPVIAAINGSAQSVIDEAKCGICVPAENAEALSDAMLDFIKCPQKYCACGKNGRQYFRKHFTFDLFMTDLQKQLEQTIGGKGAQDGNN